MLVKVISFRYLFGMSTPPVSADRIAEMLIHVGRASRSDDSGSDLTAAQWTCLRFFSRSNRSTRTPSAFASFHATTRGTASQIIKTLEQRGMILRHKSLSDGRSVRFDLTQAGVAALAKDPLADLVAVLDDLDIAEQTAFLSTLSRLTSSLAAHRGVRAFGTCRDCTHFTPEGQSGYCACMAANLISDEIDQLCASYCSPDGPAAAQTEGLGK